MKIIRDDRLLLVVRLLAMEMMETDVALLLRDGGDTVNRMLLDPDLRWETLSFIGGDAAIELPLPLEMETTKLLP
ncbi:hypothetical protein ACLOJK_007098 [Asimina triloba]